MLAPAAVEYNLGLTACLAVRLIGLWLVYVYKIHKVGLIASLVVRLVGLLLVF